MSNDIPQLTSKLNTIGDNFVVISGNLKRSRLCSHFQKIDETLANVKILTEKLNSKDNTIGLLFNDPTLYNNLNATTEKCSQLIGRPESTPETVRSLSLYSERKISSKLSLYRFYLNNEGLSKESRLLFKCLSTDRNNIPVQTGTGKRKELK